MALVTATAFFDTSVFVAGLLEIGDDYEPCQQVLRALAEDPSERPMTAWHCCLEFYAVSTRLPDAHRISPAEALRILEEVVLSRFRILDLPEHARLPFLHAAADDGIAGGRLYDAHIAEIARLGRAKVVVTENRRHFTPLLRHGLRVLTAREFKAEARR